MLESDYHRLVAAWLDESFSDVEHEVTLDSGRRVDFVAHTPFASYVIEVENNNDGSDLYNGVGQAAVYAEETGHEPVVVVPADGYGGPPAYGQVHVETV